jgi:Cd2+/Zn2+-exporting ATPase
MDGKRKNSDVKCSDECCACASKLYEADEPQEGNRLKTIISAAIVYAVALVLHNVRIFDNVAVSGMGKILPAASLGLFFAAYLLCGFDVVKKAVKNILRGQIFDENFLMSVASLGAVAIGQYPEAVAVMLFYQVGEYFEDVAVDRSRRSITGLMKIRPDKAFVKKDGKIIQTKPEAVRIDDVLVVRPGERIPLDGIVTAGKSYADTSSLTGESVPREIYEGSEVMSGYINTVGVLEVRVTRVYEESAVSRILNLMENAVESKARQEQFITRFARFYTPAVCIAALLVAVIPPLLIPAAEWHTWLYRALIFLVVSCPCALVISVPLSFFGGIGAASREGILVKGSNYLEVLAHVDTAVFDKTGTLTKGVFIVTGIHPANSLRVSSEELIAIATHAEYYSNHPISRSLKAAHRCERCEKCIIGNVEEISGQGLRVQLDGSIVLAGNLALMESQKVSDIVPCEKNDTGTIVHVAIDGVYVGHIVISDEVKPSAGKAVIELKKAGVTKTVLLTGDTKETAEKIANGLGFDAYYSDLLPGDKVAHVEKLLKEEKRNGRLLFCGDGINDAPVIARSDVGIAMGGLGSDIAVEAADIIIMNDEPVKISRAVKIAKHTLRIVYENIGFALSVKFLLLFLGVLGLADMWMAVFGDVGVTFIAILNAMRLLILKKE